MLIVGAGISGIGAAYHVKTMCPNRTFAVVEGREQLAEPGTCFDTRECARTLTCTRSATASSRGPRAGDRRRPSILAYLRETVEEFDPSPGTSPTGCT